MKGKPRGFLRQRNAAALRKFTPRKQPDTWACGHQANAMCGECYRVLIQRANALVRENMELRARLEGAPK